MMENPRIALSMKDGHDRNLARIDSVVDCIWEAFDQDPSQTTVLLWISVGRFRNPIDSITHRVEKAYAQPSLLLLIPIIGGTRVVCRPRFEANGNHLEAFSILSRTSSQGVALGPSRSRRSKRRSSS